MHFPALHREKHIIAALIARDDFNLRAKHFVQHGRKRFHLRTGARTADNKFTLLQILKGGNA